MGIHEVRGSQLRDAARCLRQLHELLNPARRLHQFEQLRHDTRSLRLLQQLPDPTHRFDQLQRAPMLPTARTRWIAPTNAADLLREAARSAW
jgi:hypothetical protein